MKLIMLLIMVAIFNAFGENTYSQNARVNLDFDDVPMQTVLSAIEDQSEFFFLYSSKMIDVSKNVDIHITDKKIVDVLDVLLSGTDFQYFVKDRQILLIKKETNAAAIFQQRKITGTITDAGSGESLPGVNVMIKGTSQGVISDINGKFNIDVDNNDVILVFSFIGYLSEEIMVSGQSIIDIHLVPDIKELEEVVVVGYGFQKKADLTGSVASVKGDELTKISGANASTAFAGRMPGVMVTQNSGEPGAGSSIKIRGIGSLNSNNDPLVLIDGFEGNLDNVAPYDIESISVLKDASSAAIYGARAANGVILVTTKKGQKDQPLKIDFMAKIGFQQATHLPEILKTSEWCNKSNETAIGAGASTGYWLEGDPLTDPDLQTTDFDWMGYIFRSAPVMDYNASITGGASKLRYSVNLGYFDQDGITIGENYSRANLRANIDYIGDKLSMGANVSQFRGRSTSSIDRGMAIRDIFRTPPTIAAYNVDGTISAPRDGYPGEAILDLTPSMDAAARDYRNEQNSSTANLYIEIALLKGLKFKTVFNVNSWDSYTETFLNMWQSYRPDGTKSSGNAVAEMTSGDNANYLWEVQNMLTYTLNIQDHHIDALALVSSQKSKGEGFFVTMSGFSRNNLHSIGAGSTLQSAGGTTWETALSSQLGRLNYSFKSKYLLQLNIRRDGSSVFAPGHQWGIFPSASAGWRISEENFMNVIPAISNLKVRAGYGTLGNQGIPAYKWLGLMNFQRYVINNTIVATAQQEGLYTEDITWEKTTTLNVGLDLGLFKEKLSITADIFNRRTTDMLLEFPVPMTSGGGANPYLNVGEVENKGWEFSLGYNDHLGEFAYGASFNISHVKNNVVKLDEGIEYVDGDYVRTDEGQALRSYYGYVVEGIWQSQEEVTESGYTILAGGSTPGDFRYKDLDHNSIIDSRDRTFIGNPFPRFYYGGNVFMRWKGFDFSMFIQGVFDREIYVTPEYGMDLGRYDYSNVYKEFYNNTWKTEGDNSLYPQLGHSTNNSNINSTWVQDASYLRVKNLEIGYKLPKNITMKAHIENVRIFATATNLLTLTDYVGLDPEMNNDITYGGAEYPQARTYSLGVNITF